jgi:CheY-like chemotaxis protein
MSLVASTGGASIDESMEELIAQKSRRILLVDDVLGDAQMLAELLIHLGQDARAVGNGAHALEIVSSFAPDVIILDLDMPGLDGFAVAKALKQMPGQEKLGLFALSGWSDNAVRERCSQVGFHRFFSKPVPANQVLFALAEYC